MMRETKIILRNILRAKKYLLFFLFFCGLFFKVNSFANEVSQNIPPDEVQNQIQPNYLLGNDTLKFFGLKVYDILLWSNKETFSYNQKLAININYNMNFSVKELTEKSIEEIKKNYEISENEQEIFTKKLNEIFVNIKKSDKKTAFFDPKKGVKLFHNSKLIGEINNLKFARYFIDIWLHDNSSYPSISKKLKGKIE
jgi:hypothetical protein